MTNTNNPLSKYFRQIALYTNLPSDGEYYPSGALQFDNEKELAVYPMTAKDEMMMSTPDALMNGDSTVSVIRSCVPGIKDPWMMPVLDIDTIMIAIRIATYGEQMEVTTAIPGLDEKTTVSVDLRVASDQMDTRPFDGYVPAGPISFKIKPMSYRQLTNLQLKTYEQQRLISQVVESDLNPADKQSKFSEMFMSMTNITVANMQESILEITADGQKVTDRVYINEFVDNMDSKQANLIKDKLQAQTQLGKLKPIPVSTTKEQQEKGAPEKFDVPVSMDNSNFFVSKS